MRIFVLGATGKTGSALLRLALKDGHSVTAFVRSPQKLATGVAGLTVVKGTPADIPAMAGAMAGHDAVFSALAPAIGDLLSRKRDWTMASYAENIAQAMQQGGVRRLLAFSSGALFPGQTLLIRIIDATLARHHHADLRAMEGVITKTALNWTIARPGGMSIGDALEYRAQPDAMVIDPRPMTNDGLARFLLDAAVEGRHVRQIVGVAR
jgi:putative NADH-flavin reductase